MISAGEVWLDSGSSDGVGSDSGFDVWTSGSAIGATSGSGSDSASASGSDSASVPLIVSDSTNKDQNENYKTISINQKITMHVVVLFECDCLGSFFKLIFLEEHISPTFHKILTNDFLQRVGKLIIYCFEGTDLSISTYSREGGR